MAVDLRPGDRFLDRFRIEYLAAEGGMASIYSARDEMTSHAVAVKVLYPYYSDNAIIRTRFLEEGRIQQLLKHPNIVRVFQVLDEPLMAILMEYVDGPTLDEFLGEQGPLSQEQIVDVVIPMMSAVGFAHSRGIVHRDIKPSNILLHDGDVRRPKVLDFGVAKVKGAKQDLTATGTTVGTLHYMSPEQIVGSKSIDGRADIYSIGVTMYKLVTGEVPFNAPTEFALMMAQVEAPPLPPSRLRSDLSPELESIILKAMEKRPDDRYQSIREFTQALLSLRIDATNTLRDTVSERISDQLLSFAMEAKGVALDRTDESDFATKPIPVEPPLDDPTAEIEETMKLDRKTLMAQVESARYLIPKDQHADPTVQIGAAELAALTGSDDAMDPNDVPTENIPSLQSRLKLADSEAETRPLSRLRLDKGDRARVLAPDELRDIRKQAAERDRSDETRPSTPSSKRDSNAGKSLGPVEHISTADSVERTRPTKNLKPRKASPKKESITLPNPQTKPEPKPSGPKMVLGKNYADTQERTREKPRFVPPVAPSQMGFPPLPAPQQRSGSSQQAPSYQSGFAQQPQHQQPQHQQPQHQQPQHQQRSGQHPAEHQVFGDPSQRPQPEPPIDSNDDERTNSRVQRNVGPTQLPKPGPKNEVTEVAKIDKRNLAIGVVLLVILVALLLYLFLR